MSTSLGVREGMLDSIICYTYRFSMNRSVLAQRLKDAGAKVVSVCSGIHSILLFLSSVLYSLGIRTACGLSARGRDALASGCRFLREHRLPARRIFMGLVYGLALFWALFLPGV